MITCVAIDDEPLALKQISEYISTVPFLQLDAAFESAAEAYNYIQSHQVDLIFLDVSMPDINGVDFVRSMTKEVKVVFVTAHSEFACDAFQLDAADYLLKPISFVSFLKSVNKVNDRYFKNKQTELEMTKKDDFLFINSQYKILRLKLSDIKYIESKREYVKIFLDGQEPITSLISIQKMEECLPEKRFMRVHRSFIVNLDKVTVVERNQIVFDDRVRIPVSDVYGEGFQKFMEANSIRK